MIGNRVAHALIAASASRVDQRDLRAPFGRRSATAATHLVVDATARGLQTDGFTALAKRRWRLPGARMMRGQGVAHVSSDTGSIWKGDTVLPRPRPVLL